MYVNGHGTFTAFTIVTYGKTSIDCLLINSVKRKKYVEDTIHKTVKFLENEKIEIEGIFVDAELGYIVNTADLKIAITIQSLSNRLFKTFFFFIYFLCLFTKLVYKEK